MQFLPVCGHDTESEPVTPQLIRLKQRLQMTLLRSEMETGERII